jgi:anti-sigma factor RsiW
MKLSEDDLHAYVDDRLDAERRRANVSGRMHSRPATAETAGAASTIRWRAGSGHRVRASGRGARYAIAAGWFVAGAALGWLAHELASDRLPSRPSLARQAAVAHAVYSPEVRHPVEVGAAEQEHLVNWLSKRLGAKLRAPLLTREGFELVGGRLLPVDSGAVAQFMYQDAKGKRLTLYVSRLAAENRDTAFRFSQEDKVAVFDWIDGRLGYALGGCRSRSLGDRDLGVPAAESLILRSASFAHRQST